MDKVSKADNLLIRRNVELELRHKQDSDLIAGYRARIDGLEEELEIANSYAVVCNGLRVKGG